MPKKTIAILQSSYIPWKGYFDLINSVDEFVLYDDVQYTKRDWRNRNRIKSPQGTTWLTIPVKVKGRYLQTIRETEVAGSEWAKTHWQTIAQCYRKAPYFSDYQEALGSLFLSELPSHLSELNHLFLKRLCGLLDISTPMISSESFSLEGKDKNEKLIFICKSLAATHYVSGPSARAYMSEEVFAREGIAVSFFDYSTYQPYPQVHPPFDHFVSVIDLLLNMGPEAKNYMQSFGRNYGNYTKQENSSLRC